MKENLDSSDVQIGAAFSALAIATMISPFLVGRIADRFLRTKDSGRNWFGRCRAAVLATKITGNSHFTGSSVHALHVYAHDCADQQRSFFSNWRSRKTIPWIRVFGTVGWIVAGLLVGNLGHWKNAETFIIAAGVSAWWYISFALPNTPPKQGHTGHRFCRNRHRSICMI